MVACSEECPGPASNSKNITNNKSTSSVIVTSPHSPSHGQTSKRASYELQLQAVVQGKGAKSQRRLTTRSRLRAVFALQLLASVTDITSTDVAGDIAATATATATAKISLIGAAEGSPVVVAEEQPLTDLNCMMPFLECLAELQETRLPCSEEALMDALRPSMSYATTASFSSPLSSSSSSAAVNGKMKEQRHARADARALVRTWLHDEGYHQEVTSPYWLLQSTTIDRINVTRAPVA